MNKYLKIILPFLGVKLFIQLLGNRNYGFHRDELLHLSVGEHLDWGFFEFPPFIGFIGWVSGVLFDHSLWGVRLFPTIAGCLILLFTFLIVIELGGKKRALFLAGICFLAFVPFFRNHTLFQPVAFDQLFWLIGFYALIKYQTSSNPKFLILLGVVSGLGLMNKYTMLIWGAGIAIGLFFYSKEKIYKNKWLYISGIVALLIFLPNIIWQFVNDLPLLDHMKELNESQLEEQSTFEFVLGLIEIPAALVAIIASLWGFIRNEDLKPYRHIGISVLAIFLMMWGLSAKSYYFYAAFPILFAVASVQIEKWIEPSNWKAIVVAGFILLPMIPYIPKMTPILPIETFTNWYDIEKNGAHYELTGDYADMFGWEEQVAIVDSLYSSFPDDVRANIVIWAENYGEAGAIQIIGDKYDLPSPISRHGSFWAWGYQNPNAEYWISIGNEERSVNYIFNNCTLIRTIDHPYAIREERGIPLYLCSDPKMPIQKWWADYRPFIFD